jgi:hypothetical protein
VYARIAMGPDCWCSLRGVSKSHICGRLRLKRYVVDNEKGVAVHVGSRSSCKMSPCKWERPEETENILLDVATRLLTLRSCWLRLSSQSKPWHGVACNSARVMEMSFAPFSREVVQYLDLAADLQTHTLLPDNLRDRYTPLIA